jgi:hypothetical protein
MGLERGAGAMSGAADVSAAHSGGAAAATHHTAGGDAMAARTTPAGAPDDPEDLVGLRVKRSFVDGEFEGVVVSACKMCTNRVLWCVRYADGDEEQLNWTGIRDVLVDAWPPPAAAALKRARAQNPTNAGGKWQRCA